MSENSKTIKANIRGDLEESRAKFHSVLDSLSKEDFKRQAHNLGWTNGEILAHMTFGFIIVNVLLPMTRLWGKMPKSTSKPFAWLLNLFTGVFNWFNMLGARGQGKVFTPQRIGKIFDSTYFSLLKKISSIQDNEWKRGKYYPTKWDSNFDEFMTLEKLFHYPVIHFNFHLEQIARR